MARSGRRMMMRGAVIGLALISLSACAPIFRNHGYIPMDQDLARVQIGASRDQVVELIGRPTTTTLLNDSEWYYVQSRFRTFTVFTKEIRREVVAVSFNGDRVANVERFGLEQGRVVPLSRRVTQNSVEGSSFLRQLFGSVGRIRADQVLDD